MAGNVIFDKLALNDLEGSQRKQVLKAIRKVIGLTSKASKIVYDEILALASSLGFLA